MDEVETQWKRATQAQKAVRAEREGARRESGQLMPNSGRGKLKGDYRAFGSLVDVKNIAGNSFSVSKNVWFKAKKDAMSTPLLVEPSLLLNFTWGRLRVIDDDYYLWLVAQVKASE